MAEEHKSARILVVEDSPASRRVFARCLAEFDLTAAESGEQALIMLAEAPFDLILLDVELPGIDGFEVLQQVKANPATANTMVIMVTARGQTQEVVRGFDYLADDYVPKPFRAEELVARVRASLRLKSLQDQLRRINEHLEDEVAQRTEQLMAQQKFALLGRNSAQIAHNLKSPLAVVMGYADLARDRPPDQTREMLRKIAEAAETMQEIVSRLLSDLRDDIDFMDEPDPLDLNPLITDQIAFWQVNSQFRYEVQCDTALAEDLPPVAAHRADLVQILNNLIDNALYAMRDRRSQRLRFATRQQGPFVELEVSDTGCGIPAAVIARIFEPTFTTKPAGEGTGLGLASCYELARSYGGDLAVTAEDGVGSTFVLSLPAVEV